MPERTVITELASVGVETTYGLAVATTKRLPTISLMLTPEMEAARIRPNGYKAATVEVPAREWSSGDVEGYPCYNAIVYPLSSLLAVVAPTGTGPNYSWDFGLAPTTVQTVRSFTIEQGDAAVRAHKASGMLFTAFGMEFPRAGDPSITGTLLGQRLSDGIVVTPGTVEVPVQPILSTEVDVYLDLTQATLGGTKLTRVVNVAFEIADMWGPVWALNTTNQSFVAPVQTEPALTATLTVEADAAGMEPLTAMRTGATRYMRMRATGPTLGATTYSLIIDLCLKVSGPPTYGDEDSVRTVEWPFEMIAESAAYNPARFVVTNAVAAL
jgi:Phage tail tube protein